MRKLTARDLGRPFISLDDERKVLQGSIPFFTDTGYGNFFVSLLFLCRWQRVTFVKLLFIERYKWQTSYRTCIKIVLEKSAFSTLLIFYFISCEVGRRTQPSSIHLNSQPYHCDTRWFRLILYDLYFYFYFFVRGDTWLADARAFSRPTHFLREKPWGRGWPKPYFNLPDWRGLVNIGFT